MSRIRSSLRLIAPGGFKLRTLLAVVAILALGLALISWGKRGAEREKRLRSELIQARVKSRGDEGMRHFLGELGIVILKDATQAELLAIGNPTGNPDFSRTPTGKVLGKELVDRIARIMLDRKNYIHIGSDDMPDPQIGVRLSRGGDTIDLLFSTESSNSHQDVWVFVNSKSDDSRRIGWEKCFYDPELSQLVNDLKRQ